LHDSTTDPGRKGDAADAVLFLGQLFFWSLQKSCDPFSHQEERNDMKCIPFGRVAVLAFCVTHVVAVSVRSQEQNPKEQGRRGDPVGLRLTGRAEKNGESWQFEVVTEGSDCYYRKEWSGKEERHDVEGERFWQVSLIDGDFGGARSKSWGEFGVRGGAHSGKNGKDRAELARRLWTGTRLTGVAPDKLRTALESDHYVEEFDVPVSHDRFSVPCVIRWTDNTSAMPKKTTTYTVEKVEFRYDRDPQFFKAVKARYFPKDEDGKHTPIPR